MPLMSPISTESLSRVILMHSNLEAGNVNRRDRAITEDDVTVRVATVPESTVTLFAWIGETWILTLLLRRLLLLLLLWLLLRLLSLLLLSLSRLRLLCLIHLSRLTRNLTR